MSIILQNEKLQHLEKVLSDEETLSTFNYEKHFNANGFFQLSNDWGIEEVKSAEKADGAENDWGIEIVNSGSQKSNASDKFEVVGSGGGTSKDDMNKWGIEEVTEERPVQTTSIEVKEQANYWFDLRFRDGLFSNLEELLYFCQERIQQTRSSNIMQILDTQLSQILLQVPIEEFNRTVAAIGEIKLLLDNKKLKQSFSYLESTKSRERLLDQLEVFNSTMKRKERQIWKMDEDVKELKSQIDVLSERMREINRKVSSLSAALEDLLGKNIKRKVTITKSLI